VVAEEVETDNWGIAGERVTRRRARGAWPVMSLLELAFVSLPFIWASVVVHEYGHLVAGRVLAGIPRGAIRVVFDRPPPHVALADQDGAWIGPERLEAYQRAYARWDPHLRRVAVYIMGGFVAQTLFACVVAGFFYQVDRADLARALILVSAALNGLYLVGDLVGSLWRRRPVGDVTACLRLRPVPGVLIAVAVVAAHVLWLL